MSTATATPSATPYSRPSPSLEQRKSPRVIFPKGGVPVVCHWSSQLLLSKANSLGTRGAFIFTTSPFPLGSAFSLELGVGRKLCLHARVRSMLASFGMGVEFLNLSDESKSRLQNLLSSAS